MYKAEIWSKKEKAFIATNEFDILEQNHYNGGNNTKATQKVDYEMFVNLPLEANEVSFVKISKASEPYQYVALDEASTKTKSKLEINGFTESNEALFKFENYE